MSTLGCVVAGRVAGVLKSKGWCGVSSPKLKKSWRSRGIGWIWCPERGRRSIAFRVLQGQSRRRDLDCSSSRSEAIRSKSSSSKRSSAVSGPSRAFAASGFTRSRSVWESFRSNIERTSSLRQICLFRPDNTDLRFVAWCRGWIHARIIPPPMPPSFGRLHERPDGHGGTGGIRCRRPVGGTR